MYNVPLGFQCIYGRSDEGDENGDGKEGARFLEEGERVRSEDCLASCI